jgi:hypothetical protein
MCLETNYPFYMGNIDLNATIGTVSAVINPVKPFGTAIIYLV